MTEVEELENEKPDECEGCEYPTPDLTFYEGFKGADGSDMQHNVWLCKFCEGTSSGQAAMAMRRNEHVDAHLITSTICYAANVLLAELHKDG